MVIPNLNIGFEMNMASGFSLPRVSLALTFLCHICHTVGFKALLKLV